MIQIPTLILIFIETHTSKLIIIQSKCSEFKVFYSNSDQLLNKRDDLLMQIDDTPPDIILITEVIPKAQINPIDEARLNIQGLMYS